jgi:DNA-binding transcriptional LysR family regulator
MDFRELQYIVTIARLQNVTKASEELHVSQPTLSKFVQNFEHILGQPVFRRMGNKFLLTFAGERYVERAKEILAIKKDLDTELGDIVRKDIGELKIAFPIMRGTYMLPCTLPVFQNQFPNVKITVHEQNSEALEDLILSGEIDLAFFSLPILRPNIDYVLIKNEEILLIMSPGHPLADKGEHRADCAYPWMDMKRIKEERFILQKLDQRTRHIADKLFHEVGFKPNVVLSVRNILASVQLACNGYGMTFVAESHLRHIETKVKPACFSVGNPCTTTSFVAAYRNKSYLPYYTKQYIEIVKTFT